MSDRGTGQHGGAGRLVASDAGPGRSAAACARRQNWLEAAGSGRRLAPPL